MSTSPTPSPTAGAPAPGSEAEALQTVLAAEHSAVFVYGALGAQASQTDQRALYRSLLAAYRRHRTRRDDLRALIAGRGATPAPAAPAYALPADLGTPEAVREQARAVEAACARSYAYLVASSSGDVRRAAVDDLVDAAVRGVGFGAAPEALPGT